MKKAISLNNTGLSAAAGITAAWLKRKLAEVSATFERWVRFNATVAELGALSDRELADIGINRSDIPQIAYKDCYETMASSDR